MAAVAVSPAERLDCSECSEPPGRPEPRGHRTEPRPARSRLGYRVRVSRTAQRIVIAVIALALVVSMGAVGLAGLFSSPDDTQAQDPTDTRAAVDPSSQPQPSPTAKPEAPAEMTQQSPEGAQATLRYMLDSYAYMMATGDTESWEGSISPECQVCVQFVANAKQLHTQGGWSVGGEFTVGAMTFQGNGEPPASGIATAEFHQAEQRIIDDPAKEAATMPEVDAQIQASMVWDGERWRVGDMSIIEPGTGPSDAGGGAGAASDAGGAAG